MSSERSWGAGGFSSQASLTLPQVDLILGQIQISFPNRKVTDRKIGIFAKLDGVLGNDLGVRRLMIDYPKGQFELE